MDSPDFFGSGLFTWIILPTLIFIARILDVTIGTIRVIFVSRGTKSLAPLLGFFEVLIWLLAIGQIMQNLTNVLCYVAYAGGFAAGTFVGISIENRLSIGMGIIRIITSKDATELIESLESANYGVTIVDARGARGQVRIILSVIHRREAQNVARIIKEFDPHAFYSLEDVRSVSEGVFPPMKSHYYKSMILRLVRKGK